MSSEDGLDAGQYSRGALVELLGYPVDNGAAEASAEMVPLQLVTDAKGNFDKCNSDTPAYGSQKSLAFTIAWLRSALRGDNTKMAWTSTQNMFADGGTKLMKLEHMSRILQSSLVSGASRFHPILSNNWSRNRPKQLPPCPVAFC